MENVHVNILMVCVAWVFVSAVYDIIKNHIACRAADLEYEACLCFSEWRKQNPGVYIGLSDEGVALVWAWIHVLDWYQKTHPWKDCSEKRQQLLALLNNLPPKRPIRNLPTSIRKGACFLVTKLPC
jgi:hypothetical protein